MDLSMGTSVQLRAEDAADLGIDRVVGVVVHPDRIVIEYAATMVEAFGGEATLTDEPQDPKARGYAVAYATVDPAAYALDTLRNKLTDLQGEGPWFAAGDMLALYGLGRTPVLALANAKVAPYAAPAGAVLHVTRASDALAEHMRREPEYLDWREEDGTLVPDEDGPVLATL